MTRTGTVAVVYGSRAGIGGLGVQCANAIADLAGVAERVVAVGPGRAPGMEFDRVDWKETPRRVSPFAGRFTWLRWLTGRGQYLTDRHTGSAAAAAIPLLRPELAYCFTQVALETIHWAKKAGVPVVLESPNGHLRNFRDVYHRETRRFGKRFYLGHPTSAMVRRVEEEYAGADLIRVSSEWARDSLVSLGVACQKVVVIGQRPTASGIRPAETRLPPEGPLRVCFVGTLDLRKGFVYLLRAVRRFGPERVVVRLVGGTVDRMTRKLLAREREGLNIEVAPGHPLASLHWAELFALPTLEDGSPFAVVEAMAAGLPVLVTDACGNAPLIRPEATGWVVPAADASAIAEVLENAWARRTELGRMGNEARADWERLARSSNHPEIRDLIDQAQTACTSTPWKVRPGSC
jgi:glycosyltransferase involved in cell wall biosynthesis